MISDTTTSARYIVTNGVLGYSIPFRIYTEADVAVFWSADARTDTKLTLGTHYTVTILSEGGTVNLLPGVVPVGAILAVVSNIPATQEADFSSTSTVNTEALETQLDRQVQMIQQIDDSLARAVILPATSSETPQDVLEDVFLARDRAENAAANVQQWLNEVGTEVGSHSYVTATETTTARTLADRFADVINVKDFGAKGDGVTDDTAAIQAALNNCSSGHIVMPAGTYRCTATLTANFENCIISGNGSTIDFSSTGSNSSVISLQITRSIAIGNLRIKVNKSAYAGLVIIQQGSGYRGDVTLSDISVSDVYRAGLDHPFGDGIYVKGGFTSVSIIRPIVRNCTMAQGAGVQGRRGVFGISVVPNYISATEDDGSSKVTIVDPYIENVYSEDPNYAWDQDAIRLFTGYYAPVYSTHQGDVRGGVFKNIRGRGVKFQGHASRISGASFYNAGSIGGSSSLINAPLIDVQTGTAIIDDISIYSDGVINNVTVQLYVDRDDPGKVVPKAKSIISNIRVHTGNSEFKNFVKILSDYDNQPHTVLMSNIVVSGGGSYATLLHASNTGSYNINADNIVIGITKSWINFERDATAAVSLTGIHNARTTNVPTVSSDASVTIASMVVSGRPNSSNDAFVVKRDSNCIIKAISGDSTGYPTISLEAPGAGLSLGYSVRPVSNGGVTSPGLYVSSGSTALFTGAINAFYPGSSEQTSLGLASKLWSTVYAATSAISTSDERLKQDITDIQDAVFRAWRKVTYRQYLFINSVNEKGDAARIHTGVIAQQIIDAFASEGLDAAAYGLLCYDKWDDEYETQTVEISPADADSNELSQAATRTEQVLIRSAGDRYGIRYEEALCLEAAYQRHMAGMLEDRITALEAAIMPEV